MAGLLMYSMHPSLYVARCLHSYSHLIVLKFRLACTQYGTEYQRPCLCIGDLR